MALPARFFTEMVVHDDGTEVGRELIELTHPDGTLSVREATDEDRAMYGEEYALFRGTAKEGEPAKEVMTGAPTPPAGSSTPVGGIGTRASVSGSSKKD